MHRLGPGWIHFESFGNRTLPQPSGATRPWMLQHPMFTGRGCQWPGKLQHQRQTAPCGKNRSQPFRERHEGSNRKCCPPESRRSYPDIPARPAQQQGVFRFEKLGAPVQKIITTKDAYFIGVRKNKLIVVGSNARGTAYAILESRRWQVFHPGRTGTT